MEVQWVVYWQANHAWKQKKIHVNTDTRCNDNIDLHPLNAVYMYYSNTSELQSDIINPF